jgi:uncharacterized PurR-regulated membrane protein YhhQ (DUF165 family)
MILIALYIATIPAANYLIGHVGTVCVPQGPCLIPVAPGIMAPSGVLMIGAALLLRDLVQRQRGIPWSLACIGAGTVLSFLIASPALAVASGSAFLFSEFADFAVFTPLYRKRLMLAVTISVIAGAVTDSILFLLLAFGSLEHITGQIVGKMYAALAFVAWRKICAKNQSEAKC